jgi:hypothetical protein
MHLPRGGSLREQRPWLVFPCSMLVLIAISGAFLIGLMTVGLVAPTICGFAVLRKRLARLGGPSPLLTRK